MLIDAFVDVFKNDRIDQYNKLQVYNILKYTEFVVEDERIKHRIAEGITANKYQLYPSILNRLNDPHLELKNLLIRDSAELVANFEIKSSTIGHIYTAYTDGETWIGQFNPKNTAHHIVFDVIMRADTILDSINDL